MRSLDELQLIATTGFGLESLVREELLALGFNDPTLTPGRVHFTGDLEAICTSNLWLRVAERVVLSLGSFMAPTFDHLYDGLRELPWTKWMPKEASFPVDVKTRASKLTSVPACQSVGKKAVVDSMKEEYNVDWFPENGPLYPIRIELDKNRATVAIDTTGPGLHKRGYRNQPTEAPLQETVAAAMIYWSKWQREKPLIDPLCGSGTIPIEAAMMGSNTAPGLRRYFISEDWPRIPAKLWQRARKKARAKRIKNPESMTIKGFDHQQNLVDIARYHAEQAGVRELIDFKPQPLSDLKRASNQGSIITNPPYGERLQDSERVKELYALMGKTLLPLKGWSLNILTSHQGFEEHFGSRATRKRSIYSGGLECNYYQYFNQGDNKEEGGQNHVH